MSVHDLTFKDAGVLIYDPLAPTVGVSKTITVTNNGTEDLTGLGFFIRPATNLGQIDNPASYPPETDYQDLLTWGEAVDGGLTIHGSLINRTVGNLKSTKILLGDLAAGANTTFEVLLEFPLGAPARRLFIDLVLE